MKLNKLIKECISELLIESPAPLYSPDQLDNSYAGKEELKSTLLHGKDRGVITVGGKKYMLFVETINGIIEYKFLNLQKNKILGAHAFKNTSYKGHPMCLNEMIWNSPDNKGFIRNWFDEVILKKYKYFMSADSISDKGMKFWKWLVEEYVMNRKTHKIFVRSETGQEDYLNNSSELESYRKNADDSDYVFVLEKV